MGALVPGGSAGGWPAEAPDPYVAVEQAEAATTINNAINFMASIGITILRELRLRSRSTATAATGCDELASGKRSGESPHGLCIMRTMNKLLLSLAAVLAACGSHPVQPQSGTASTQHGVYTADLDRSADPCTDFFAFSNGMWRKQNPIPAAMDRWSRRWESGETPKDRL